MYKIFIILFFLHFSFIVKGQSNPYSSQITEQGNKMINALLSKQYDSLLNFMYPKMIEILGGKEELKKSIRIVVDSTKMKIISASIGKPNQIFKVKNEYQCLVPEILELKVKGGKLRAKSYLIAISQNEGKNWFFLDTAPGLQKMKKQIKISKKIKLPQKEKPLFIPD